ncbi:cysteine desulfurase family protein [Candidatus Neomarinimicrobiota bacterium]
MYYFDHSATTPIYPEVIELMNDIGTHQYGNPSSVHSLGQETRNIIEVARKQIADAINAPSDTIIFTGGGSEANNLVLWSLIHLKKQHVITSAIEHPAVLNVLKALKPFGITHTIIPVDKYGIIQLDELKAAIKHDTGMISIMYANNEVGSIQPLSEIVSIAQEQNIPVHSDAVQTLGKIPINVVSLPADYLSFSAHKFYGPKGVGFLYKKRGQFLKPLIIGGGQERKLRAGTENVVGIAGMGLAANLVTGQPEKNRRHLESLSNQFKTQLLKEYPEAIFNGSEKNQLPGLISVVLPAATSDLMMIGLGRNNMAVSNGAACSSGTVEPSHVLQAMKIRKEHNIKTLRISFGKDNNSEEVRLLVETITSLLKQFRMNAN